jgi:hypothetical protein
MGMLIGIPSANMQPAVKNAVLFKSDFIKALI